MATGKLTGRILVVDDDEMTLRALVALLELRLYRVSVVAVSSAQEALSRLADSSFDLIISDLAMPGMTGLDLLSHLHALHPQIPVVLLSGHVSGRMAPDPAQANVFAFLQKPVDRDYLTFWVKRGLELSHLRQQAQRPRGNATA